MRIRTTWKRAVAAGLAVCLAVLPIHGGNVSGLSVYASSEKYGVSEDNGTVKIGFTGRQIWDAAEAALNSGQAPERELKADYAVRYGLESSEYTNMFGDGELYELQLPSDITEELPKVGADLRIFVKAAEEETPNAKLTSDEFIVLSQSDDFELPVASSGNLARAGRSEAKNISDLYDEAAEKIGEDEEQKSGESGYYHLTGNEDIYFLLVNQANENETFNVKVGGYTVIKNTRVHSGESFINALQKKVKDVVKKITGGAKANTATPGNLVNASAANLAPAQAEIAAVEKKAAELSKKVTVEDEENLRVSDAEAGAVPIAARLQRMPLDDIYQTYLAEDEEAGYRVKVTAARGSIPNAGKLVVSEIGAESEDYAETMDALAGMGITPNGARALDIRFEDLMQRRTQPKDAGIVNISVTLANIPETADEASFAVYRAAGKQEIVTAAVAEDFDGSIYLTDDDPDFDPNNDEEDDEDDLNLPEEKAGTGLAELDDEGCFVANFAADTLDPFYFTWMDSEPAEPEDRIFDFAGSDYSVHVEAPAEAGFPENTELKVTEILAGDEGYEAYAEAAEARMKEEDAAFTLGNARFFDITFVSGGEKIEPAAEVEVTIEASLEETVSEASSYVLHFPADPEEEMVETIGIEEEKGAPDRVSLKKAAAKSVKREVVKEAPELMNADIAGHGKKGEYRFKSDRFSVFAIVWNNAANSSTNVRWRYNNNNTRGQITVYYVNTDGASITRPAEIGGNYDIAVGNGNFTDELVFSDSNVARAISERTYEKAYIVLEGGRQEITGVVASRSGGYGSYTYAMTYYNGEEEVYTNSGSGSTNFDRPEVYLQYTSIPNEGNKTTIHFGYMRNGRFVEFTNAPSPSFDSAALAYLVYDFDGYQYEGHTYYCTSETATPDDDGTRVQALLRNNNGTWQYHNYSTTYSGNSGWTNIANGSHFYLLYEPNPATQPGGTPTVKPVNPDDEPDAPELTKNSLNNGDGTNTISLGITGSTTELEVMKLADVIVVFDASGSMLWDMDGNTRGVSDTETRLYYAKNATRKLAENLLAKVNSEGDKLVRMHLLSFNADAQLELTDFTEDYDTFASAVGGSSTGTSGGITTAQGTNWESALLLANSLTVDAGRATFVIFVTDGEPTARISRENMTDQELIDDGISNSRYIDSDIFNSRNEGGAHYDAAVPVAQAIVEAGKNFYTIGISNDVSSLDQLTIDSGAGSGHSFSATDEQGLKDAFDEIEASITALLGAGDVQVTDGITSLSNLEAKVLETVDPDSFRYYRYGGWKTTSADGEEVKTKDKYGADYEHKTEWTTREADGCAAAEYDEATGAVKWDMGRNFQLEKDVTYVVEFRVWPSQTAYDLIANLNNGTREYRVKSDESDAKGLTQEEYDQIDYDEGTDSYTLKTNTEEVGATYTLCTKTGVTVTYKDDAEEKPVTYVEGTLEPMALMSELMTIKKEWAHEFNDSHAGDQVKFFLKVGDDGYYQNDGTVSTSEENADSLVLSNPDWVESIYVAPGMLDYVDGEVKLLETGHEYELYEYEITQADSTDNYIASYDFISETVRPMRVNGDLKYLVKYTDAAEIPDGVTETYTIDGKTYYVRAGSGDNGLLSGTNYRRAEMDITKVVNPGISGMTEEQLNKEVFTYRVTLKMPSDADLSLITGWQFVYRPDNPNWTIQGYQEEDEPLAGDETRFSGYNFRWGTFNYNGTSIGEAAVVDSDDPDYVTITMDLSMYPNQVLRLTNLPMGTEYRIEEVYANNRTLGSNGLMSNASVVPTTSVVSNLADEGYTQISSASTYGTADGKVISGTIANPNRRYYNQFTNTVDNVTAVDFQVTKHLDGYAWSGERYYFTLEAGAHKKADGTEAGTSPLPASTSLYLSNASGSEDRSYGFGSVKYGEEGTYTYTVKEARYRAGNSTTIVDIDQAADTIPDTGIVFEKPVEITVTVSKEAGGSLYVEKVEGTRTELTGTVINTTFTNSQPCAVKILKVGDSTKPLSGVPFAVYSDSDLTQPVTTDAEGEPVGTDGVITTDEDGFASLGSMISGTSYYLVETDTVGGYNLLSKPVVITFNGTNVTASCEQENVIFNSPEWIYKAEDGAWVVKINNSSGVSLPSTGGPGTALFRIFGLMLLLGGALLLAAGRRRED